MRDLVESRYWKRRWYWPFGPKLAEVCGCDYSAVDGSPLAVKVRNAHEGDKARVTYSLGKPNRRGWPTGYQPAQRGDE